MLESFIGQSAAILDSYSIALVVVKDRHIVWANQAMHTIFGYGRNELIGQPTRILFIDQASYERFGEEVYSVLREDKSYNGCHPQKRKDGSLGWFECNISRFKGHSDMAVGAIVDRTESYRAFQQLEESESRYRQVVEDQTEVISRFLPNSTFIFVNDVFCRVFGKSADELIGHRWHPVAHPDDLSMIEARLRTMSPVHPVVTIENRVLIAGGEQRWMQFVNRGFFDTDGTLKEIQSVGRDITYLKQVESDLREKEDTLQRAQSVGRIGSFSMSHDAETFSISQETARLFDLDDNGVATVNEWFSRIHPEDQAKAESAWCAALKGAPYDLTYRIIVRGQMRWIHALAALQFDGRGQFANVVGTVQDISELKQTELNLLKAQQKAEKANQAKTRFLAAASHDLRQPLQAILILLEVIAGSQLDASQKDMVEQLTSSSKSLADILNQLLDLSRLESGTIQAVPEVVDTEDLMKTINKEFSSLAATKQLPLDLFFSRRCPLLFTDKNLLLNLLRNLVGNAVKFTKKGRVLLAIRRQRKRALIQVWDSGIGIPQEAQDSIFDEYVQIGNLERDRSKGVGLGLAIAKNLAKLLDTEIRCRSRVGKGSVFEFTVLLRSTHQNDDRSLALENATNGHASQLLDRRILIVEDDPDLAKALKLAFETHDLQVLLFDSAENAMASSTLWTADYYLCDYRLPGMDGLQFLDVLRKNATKTIKAALLTGENSPDSLARMNESGWPILRKPVPFETLLSTLMSAD